MTSGDGGIDGTKRKDCWRVASFRPCSLLLLHFLGGWVGGTMVVLQLQFAPFIPVKSIRLEYMLSLALAMISVI
jgi:hypothetical protein